MISTASGSTAPSGAAERVSPPSRLLLLTHSYWPEHSPPQRRWNAFAADFIGAGWDVHVVAPVAHGAGSAAAQDGAAAGRGFRVQRGPHGERIVRVPFLPHRNSSLSKFTDQFFSAILSVPAAWRVPRVDVVLATAPSLPILATGYLTARLRRVPFVVEMRDAWPDLARDARLVKGRIKSVAEWAVDFVQRRADLVVTVTEGFAQTLRDRGIRQVACVSNGVRVGQLPELPQPPEHRERFTAVYLGNLGRSQRIDVAIKAAAMVGPGMHLHIVGHGVEHDALVALAAELDAPVTFHGVLRGPDVMARYADADTCVVALRDDWKSFETTVPSKLYEVLALDRHVTAVVRGEAARIIDAADAGHIVACHPEPLAALWRHLAANRHELRRSGSGRRWVSDHADHGLLASHYRRILEELLANPGTGETP
ncbi:MULTISPECIES: glycosyltransferase family 4 protein [Arthrobacter]|uniref:D-inositol 3-phosphate glycosyltransferase n=2 Tax=Arthrobacter TaxID=1663 RepID=A0ABU9KRT2_9MICC|nr:glycosyltransferase family 4 protein [Arthrobacter sp. YJM1]MDP5228557.1 glycosyltransferase family 4 protein [Arthrobacter sp. YJM1]